LTPAVLGLAWLEASSLSNADEELESEVYSIFAEPLGLPECTFHIPVQKTWTTWNKADRL
jgi:hypothetical protein